MLSLCLRSDSRDLCSDQMIQIASRRETFSNNESTEIIRKEKNNVTASGLGFDIPIAYSPK
jgi:hypothetical protein